MTTTITGVDVHDVRFPTAAAGDGSDAINRGDYSATYVELRTDGPLVGAGLTFTNGRGNEITCAAVRALAHHVVGRTVEEIVAEPVDVLALAHRRRAAALAGPGEGRHPHGDRRAGQRGLGPAGPAGRQPLWRLLAELPTDELVASVDFHHITDALTPDEAPASWTRAAPGYARPAGHSWSATASPRTPPRSAGSATPTTRCGR